MTDEKISQQMPKRSAAETASGDAGRIFGQDRIMVIAAAAVLVIAVIAVLIYALAAAGVTHTAPNSSLGANGINASQSTPNVGGGPRQSYMSQIQMQEVIGPGGIYNSSGTANPALFGSYINSMNTTMFYGNVTSAWIATYYINPSAAYSNTSAQSANSNTSQMVSGVLDLAYQSPKPLYLYMALIRNETLSASDNSILARNATENSMTYTAFRIPVTSGAASVYLIGYKNREVSTVVMDGGTVNVSALAAIVAEDMP